MDFFLSFLYSSVYLFALSIRRIYGQCTYLCIRRTNLVPSEWCISLIVIFLSLYGFSHFHFRFSSQTFRYSIPFRSVGDYCFIRSGREGECEEHLILMSAILLLRFVGFFLMLMRPAGPCYFVCALHLLGHCDCQEYDNFQNILIIVFGTLKSHFLVVNVLSVYVFLPCHMLPTRAGANSLITSGNLYAPILPLSHCLMAVSRRKWWRSRIK